MTDAKLIEIDVTCPMCGKEETLHIPEEGYERWQMGELIQTAMETVPAEIREQLISGLCTSCQATWLGGDHVDDEG